VDEVAHILRKCDPADDATKKMVKMFRRADDNKSGSISSTALLDIMVQCGMDPASNPGAKEVFQQADHDGDGV
jgi:Ca2+-binding EF-hand superfamily protein